mgnify:CR=1 FL=1|tara:strand:+ start:375 stop:560 length:186 start_codon:yes stop_codon:yes gene_type:complete
MNGIKNVKKTVMAIDGTTESNTLKVTDKNDVIYFVPKINENLDYQKVLEWVAEGNTIEEAD